MDRAPAWERRPSAVLWCPFVGVLGVALVSALLFCCANVGSDLIDSSLDNFDGSQEITNRLLRWNPDSIDRFSRRVSFVDSENAA